MIRRALYHVAGVDRATLETCPATDKVWAAHLGFSLCLSFIVVFGISFHATGYMIADPWVRGSVSLVIALTVFMFDRALYQSDWFYQGFLWQPGPDASGDASGGRSARRFLRIGIRLAMSFGLAWVIAVFLELAIFSDTIGDKIKRDHVAVNQPVYQKIEQYQAELGGEIEQRRKSLAALEATYRDELASAAVVDVPEPTQLADLDQQIKALDAQESDLRTDLRQIQEQIKTYAADMNAEQLGQRISASNSGRAGAGPRYQFAKQQKEVYEAQRTAGEAEIVQLRVKRDDLRAVQTRVASDVVARRDQARAAVQGKRDALRTQVEQVRADLKELEATRLSRVDDFRQKALAASDFQKQKDDPLSRMTAYQELKNDPKDGATITLFSWMTKFLIIFLEIVPVVAKLFFSPPSVYAAKIQAEVERERRRAQLDTEKPLVRREPAIEKQMEEIAAQVRQDVLSPADGPARNEPARGRISRSNGVAGGYDVSPSIAPPEEDKAGEAPLRSEEHQSTQTPSEARASEVKRRNEMERLINEETARRTRTRTAGTKRPVGLQTEPAQPNALASLGFSLQDDIPQKP